MKRAALLLLGLCGCAAGKPYQIKPCDGCLEPYSAFDNELASCHAAPYRPEDEDSFADERVADHACLARAYIALGNKLESLDPGGASRAYWGALNTISRALSSRRMKEFEVMSAFNGLSEVAKKRRQMQWAGLLHLCGRMAWVYADSREGKADDAAFDAAMAQIRAARQAAMEAHYAAKQGVMRQLGMSVMSLGGGINANSVGQAVIGAGSAMSQGFEADSALKQATSQASAKFQDVAGLANAQFLDVKTGHRFAAERVAYYLLATEDTRPYLEELMKIARDQKWDGVVAALGNLHARRLSEDDVVPLGQELQAIETEAVMHERRNAVYVAKDLAEGANLLAAVAQRSQELKDQGKCEGENDCELIAWCEQGDGERCKSMAQHALYSQHDPERGLWFARRGCKAGSDDACKLVERMQRDAAQAPKSGAAPAAPASPRAPMTRTCAAGQEVSADTANHCCWPGQAWSPSRNACVGTPACPAGTHESSGACVAQ